jgi:hypothetical protein
MLGKQMRFLLMMAAAVGIPYVWFHENVAGPIRNTWQSLTSRSDSDARSGWESFAGRFGWTGSTGADGATVSPSNVAASASPSGFYQLDEVLRFDVTPRWITDRWPRISTVRSEHDLQGLRVPLVTGTGAHDISGSLTYYFDHHQRLRRVALRGQTGDERALIQMASARFGLKPEASLAAGMYVSRWNGRPVNVLRISLAPVVHAAAANGRLLIDMELNDPDGGHGVSNELRQALVHESHVRRWGS